MIRCALIVTFNRLEKLKISINASQEAGFEHIYIVNNASTDGTGKWLDEHLDDKHKVFTLTENCGGAAGFHYGLEKIIENEDIEWVFIFDDDAYVAHNILTQHSNLCKKYNYHAYCSKVLDLNNNPCKMNIPFRTFPKGFKNEILYAINRSKMLPDLTKEQVVSSFSFVGAVLNRNFVLKNFKYLKEDLFLYYDDVFFSFCASRDGYKILYSPKLIIYHDVINAAGVHPEWKLYYLVRNLILGITKYKGSSPFGITSVSLRLINYLFSIRFQKNKKKYLKYYVKGIYDGLTFKSGKRT